MNRPSKAERVHINGPAQHGFVAGAQGVQGGLPARQQVLQGGAAEAFQQHLGAFHASQALHGSGHGGVAGDVGGPVRQGRVGLQRNGGILQKSDNR